MNGYLKSQGYYTAKFVNLDSSYNFDTVDHQIRTTLNFVIDPGKNVIIDSVYYDIGDTLLGQNIKCFCKKQSYKTRKASFSKQVIATELDREVALFRQRGYFLLTRENLVAEIDTTNASLLQLTLDPFEQAQKIAEAAESRQQNPHLYRRCKKEGQF